MLWAEQLDRLPLWLLLVVTIVILVLSSEGGRRLGTYWLHRFKQEHDAHVLALVSATMGFLAFVMAFTFSLAEGRFESRKQLVVDEANAIETTYLRAGLLPGDHTQKIRGLLREYVQLRLEAATSPDVEGVLSRSEGLHRALWKEAEAVGREAPESTVVGNFIESLSRTIELHTMRVKVAIRGFIPGVLWAALLLVAILTLAAVGYHAGLVEARRSPVMVTVIASFSIILMLIADLDRPQEGLLNVSQQAMIDLQHRFSN